MKLVLLLFFYIKLFCILGCSTLSAITSPIDSTALNSYECSKGTPFHLGINPKFDEIDPDLKSMFPVQRQGRNAGEYEDKHTNLISVELFGRAWLYSINFDHQFSDRLLLGFGASVWDKSFLWKRESSVVTVIPIYVNYYYFLNSNRFFVTGGVDFISSTQTINPNITFEAGGLAAVMGGGYEYRSPKGFVFRSGHYIVIGSSLILIFGANFGLMF